MSSAAAPAANIQETSQAVLAAKCWWYCDPQGVVQGPFSTNEMRHWNTLGYFSPDLPIRYTENGEFYPLRALYPGGLVPFLSSPAKPAPAGVAAAVPAPAALARQTPPPQT